MSYKTVLVHVEAAAGAAPRLACAAAVARQFDALLLGVGAETVKSLGVSDPYGFSDGPWISALQERADANLLAAEAAFGACAASQPTEWRAVRDLPRTALLHAARAADLIVAGGAAIEAAGAYPSTDLGDLLLASGRPVLVAPPGGGALSGQSVVVAWKDTREARRAVADALPFLKRAARVLVLEVCVQDQARAAEIHTTDVAQALGRHGVQADAEVLVAESKGVCAQIDARAESRSADLVVAGAYGRSRLSEWAFGGVTHDLLRSSKRFLLLSH